MRIAFFGSYFLNFEKIIKNCSIKNNSKFYFFTDKKSFSYLFKDVNVSYVELSSFPNKNLYNLKDKEIEDFFICDKDRFDEFNIKKPSIRKLKKTANLILKNFEKWYLNNNPEILLCEGPTNFFNRLIIYFLEKNKINYFTFRTGRISNSVYLEKNKKIIFNTDFTSKINHKKDYMNPRSPLHRNIIYKLLFFKKTSLYRDIIRIKNFWKIINKEDYLLAYSGKSIELLIKTRTLYVKKIILNFLINLLNLRNYKGYQKYFIYPEHYRPESATSAYDNNYINDLENIKLIKNKLNDPILFRFHPSYYTKRPIIQLIKILYMCMPYISKPNQSIEDLILNSKGSISISSSFALDTIKLGKPSIVLGHPEYLNSKEISKNLLVIRNEKEYSKIQKYLENYKKIDNDKLDSEMQKLYHPYNIFGGEWINILIKECQV